MLLTCIPLSDNHIVSLLNPVYFMQYESYYMIATFTNYKLLEYKKGWKWLECLTEWATSLLFHTESVLFLGRIRIVYCRNTIHLKYSENSTVGLRLDDLYSDFRHNQVIFWIQIWNMNLPISIRKLKFTDCSDGGVLPLQLNQILLSLVFWRTSNAKFPKWLRQWKAAEVSHFPLEWKMACKIICYS